MCIRDSAGTVRSGPVRELWCPAFRPAVENCHTVDVYKRQAWRNRFGLHSFILYSVRVHQAFKNLGRDGKQCNDETEMCIRDRYAAGDLFFT